MQEKTIFTIRKLLVVGVTLLSIVGFALSAYIVLSAMPQRTAASNASSISAIANELLESALLWAKKHAL